ncbi:MAG: 4Fe-4S dicluster domain-containing protein [Caldilineaceae bacterium]
MSIKDVAAKQLGVVDLPQPAAPERPHGLWQRILYPFARPEMPDVQPPVGFFTDTSVCIGCKACQVACKEWNLLEATETKLSGWSYDNTKTLSAGDWRHVKFIEQFEEIPLLPAPIKPTAAYDDFDIKQLLEQPKLGQWLMMSDSCKHCVAAPCNEACPTGAIVHTEFANVYIQPDICNGCSSCIAACPFGVITRSDLDGHSYKCTMCYDRLADGLEPACARACPTWAINFGPIDEMKQMAQARLAQLQSRGVQQAYLYGAEESADYSALHNFYLLLAEPLVYGLPEKPVNPHKFMRGDYLRAAIGLVAALAVLAAAILMGGG